MDTDDRCEQSGVAGQKVREDKLKPCIISLLILLVRLGMSGLIVGIVKDGPGVVTLGENVQRLRDAPQLRVDRLSGDV